MIPLSRFARERLFPQKPPPPKASFFVAMLWRYAGLFERMSGAATTKGNPKRALLAAKAAAVLAEWARFETDSMISTEGDDHVR